MKANELRIGNYVHTKRGFKIITFIDLDNEIFINEIEEIKLTAIELKSFGFEYDEETYIFKKGNVEIERIDSDYIFNFYKGIVYLKTAHQLQNLYFALTRKELTYEK